MQNGFKIGTAVVVSPSFDVSYVGAPENTAGAKGVVVAGSWSSTGEFANWIEVAFDDKALGRWWYPPYNLKAVKAPKPKVAKPSVAKPKVAKPSVAKPKKARSRLSLSHVLTLYPQTRKVLAHMEQHGSISPLEAFGVYRITRLAARINEIRDAGVEITTTMKRDATGTRYASYSLV